MPEYVLVERHPGYAEIVLNRPERRNALIQPMGAELRDAVRELSDDESISAILLRGNGGAFCSGLDLKAMNAEPPPAWLREQGATMREAHVALFECPKVVAGALERYAINAGAALALACDVLFAGETAYLQVGEIQQGVAAPNNIAWLRARFDEATTARIVFAGRRIAGPDLVAMGVAMECVADDHVLAAARAFCEELAGYPAAGALNAKAILRALGPVKSANEWFERAANSMPHARPAGPLPPVKN